MARNIKNKTYRPLTPTVINSTAIENGPDYIAQGSGLGVQNNLVEEDISEEDENEEEWSDGHSVARAVQTLTRLDTTQHTEQVRATSFVLANTFYCIHWYRLYSNLHHLHP